MSQFKQKTKEQLMETWGDLLTAEGLPKIDESRHVVMAKIFENQEADFATGTEYRDPEIVKAFSGFLTEAEIGGDHGYDATNIAAGQTSGAVTQIGPAIMGMVRRAIPNLIAFDICGVQPLNGPTGQIFSLRSVYGKDPLAAGAKEAFHPMLSPDTMHSGQGAAEAFENVKAGDTLAIGDIKRHDFADTGRVYIQAIKAVTVDADATDAEKLDVEIKKLMASGSVAEIGAGMATSVAELQEGFNGSQNNPWNEMGFRIDKQSVEVKSRQLKAQYSIELAQDLKAVHGMDADAELAGILATEIMLEINREIVDWINFSAQIGKTGFTQTNGSKAGVFDFQDPIDVKGARWAGEAYKALLIQIDKEASEIARQTGRGIGNFIIASRNVVMALAQVDERVSPAAQGLASGMNYDTTKATFAGVLGGRYKVYIDQYAREDYFTVGFKGSSELDAGIYYSPYVPLTPLRGSDPKNFQPVMGFKTRYAVGINPFADTVAQAPAGNKRISNGMPTIENSAGKNGYFRKVYVKGI
ncbi:major head protein [Acinetobacter phage vB_AbaM_Konradin]|uniref:Major capsid protein n=2 Tax=Lazarusvirus TaxID=2842820 RepID=A0A650EWF6_9CAUD|nr:major head protein [Acinetobacter phage vB_ApiM_fHyAci03]YP_009885365.1 major head protein [Acinetobacter phage vB_AbaM_Konradin]UNI74616.1 major capsid protein [Acinetobacter phage AB-Navy4]UNI74861.1 major capsid protein [Acinetobacter phage AB-Navy97]AXF40750.1 major capsid protein [Acinetobacter phage vB_ApiM_fHyAci03]QGT53945.1 major capsid protein [Acinetobacter phage vB_AbaM_Konradin]